MDLLAVLEICLFALVWMSVFETSTIHFAHDVRFVIFIFFEENNQKKIMDNRILSKKSPSLFLTTFRKNFTNWKDTKIFKTWTKVRLRFCGQRNDYFCHKKWNYQMINYGQRKILMTQKTQFTPRETSKSEADWANPSVG